MSHEALATTMIFTTPRLCIIAEGRGRPTTPAKTTVTTTAPFTTTPSRILKRKSWGCRLKVCGKTLQGSTSHVCGVADLILRVEEVEHDLAMDGCAQEYVQTTELQQSPRSLLSGG